MIIVNADDWGRSRSETDAALLCYKAGRVTSVSAMVFMEDSGRAAQLAHESGIDVGLHLNLTQPFSGQHVGRLRESHDRIVRFLTGSRYALLVYNPALRHEFRRVYEAQFEEFVRLYGKSPSHIDGHHHQHLCTNMLLDRIIPSGEKVRRNFHFWPGEKSVANRTYRRLVDWSLARRYRVVDFFFALSRCLQDDRLARIATLARAATVEVMAHPASAVEFACLMSESYDVHFEGVTKGSYSSV